MAQYFRDFRDLPTNHENFLHIVFSTSLGMATRYAHAHCMCDHAVQRSQDVCEKSLLATRSKMSQTLYAYFQRTSNSCLPSPQGPVSKRLPSSLIESVNSHVEEVANETTAEGTKGRKRGPYKKYTAKDKADVANYATFHGTSAAIRHFKARFPDLKWTTVNDWKEAMIKATKKAARGGQLEKIVLLEEKKRGRPSLLPDLVTGDIKCYIRALRDAGGVVNTAIVLAAATGILQTKDPTSLYCNGGHVILKKKSWAIVPIEDDGFRQTSCNNQTCAKLAQLRRLEGSVSAGHQGCS